MQAAFALIDLSPLAWLLGIGALLALLLLGWLGWRQRGAGTPQRLRALTWLCLFLTFDLIAFGAYTRLSDSGLGCPDWPGCYGSSSPLGAHQEISAAQSALPSGPVTHQKAWVEMVHRYLATGVGALLTVLMVWSWLAARRLRHLDGPASGVSPGWAALTFVWVCLQGLFGALTVTMKLYPAIVTAHLLGGIGLLVLLAIQAERHDPRPLVLPGRLRAALWLVAALVLAQITLGGWVSTNYAVLACSDFPTCQGQWWPPADFDQGYTLRRELGHTAGGALLPFAALTAIHLGHRLMALLVLGALLLTGLALRRHSAAARRIGHGLLLLAGWQLLSGLSNVVLGWPLAAALAHTAGAAALMAWLAAALARCQITPQAQPAAPGTRPAGFGVPQHS